jgi:hypothetical protein
MNNAAKVSKQQQRSIFFIQRLTRLAFDSLPFLVFDVPITISAAFSRFRQLMQLTSFDQHLVSSQNLTKKAVIHR